MFKLILKYLKDNKGLFGIFKKQKAPEIQQQRFPLQKDLYFTQPLRDVATLGIRAAKGEEGVPGIGYGKDFLSKATNPVIQERLRRLREEELPELTAAQSARGIARSSIATEQVRKSSRQAQGDIEQLLANFYVLNEQQKKSDITERLGLATGLQDQEAQLESQLALARQQQNYQQAGLDQSAMIREQERQNQLAAAALGAVTGGLGAAGAGGSSSSLMGILSGGFQGITGQQLGGFTKEEIAKILGGSQAQANILK